MKSFVEKLVLVACVVVGLVGGQVSIPDGGFPGDQRLGLEIFSVTGEIKILYKCYCDIETHNSPEFANNLPDGFLVGAQMLVLPDEVIVYSEPPEGRPAVIDVDGTLCQYVGTLDQSEVETIDSRFKVMPVQREVDQTFKAGSLVHLLTSVDGDVFIFGGFFLYILVEIGVSIDDFLEDDGEILDNLVSNLELYNFPPYLTYSNKVLSQDLVVSSDGLAIVAVIDSMLWEAIDVEDVDDL